MREDADIIRDILRIIRDNRTFLLGAHRHPDGDTVGSQLALRSFLEREGKTVKAVSVDPVPRIYHFLPGWEKIQITQKLEEPFDVAIILECSDLFRAGAVIDLNQWVKITINIDHHVTSEYFGEYNLVNPSASSTAEQIYNILKASGKPITPLEALYLYVGIITDTGRFQEANTTSSAHTIAAEFISKGMMLSPVEVASEIYEKNTARGMKLLSMALSTLELHLQDRVSSIVVTREMYRQTGAKEEDTEGFINFARAIQGIKVAVFFKESDSGVKVSFRSRENIDVNDLASRFGGGGHKRAAGCLLKVPLEEAREKIFKEIEKLLECKK